MRQSRAVRIRGSHRWGRRVAAALAAVVLAIPLAAAPVAAAKKKHAPKPPVGVHVLSLTQQEVRQSGVVRVELRAKHRVKIRLQAFLRRGGSASAISPLRVVHIGAGERLNLRLHLTDSGRALFARDCKPVVVQVVGRTGKHTHRRASAGQRTLPNLASSCVHHPPKGPPLLYSIGLASRSINPDPDGKWQGKNVYLGGYGFSGGQPGSLDQGRAADGILGGGPHVTAFALSDGKHPFALATIEVQGWFVANKDAPYGLVDMRKEVQKRTGGMLKASEVIVQSDHTHGGADPMGVWGNVPLEFRHFMFEQTVDAIIDAFHHLRPANLYYGWAPARDLQSNQFDYDPPNQSMDSDLRVLQARGSDDKPIATILDFSAHPTVLGSSNVHITGDWPQEANKALAARFGGKAMTIVGTLGRTQPADRRCKTIQSSDSNPSEALCKLDDYAGRVVDRTAQALAGARLISGKPIVDSRTYLIQDPAQQGIVYLGLGLGGAPAGVPLDRSLSPPWVTGNVLGTVTGSVRIGDVLLSTVPGEIYPQIALKVRDTLTGHGIRDHGFMTAGLANDQLGYIIAPYEAYPAPVMATFVSRGDQLPYQPDPIGNDNYAFNVSHTLGERVICSLLRGAGEVLGQGNTFRNTDQRCATFPNDLVYPAGEDTTWPNTP